MNRNLGQNWLLLRGLSREAAHWGEFEELMQATFPSARIHTLDLPGTGYFHKNVSPDNIPDITDIVRRQALEQGFLTQPVTILALSFGGMVAWEWMQKYPEDVNGAVLINTSLASLNPFYQRLRWQSYGKLAKVLLQTDLYRRELAIVRLISNLRDQDHKMATQWEKIQAERPVSLKNSLRQIIAAASYRPAVSKPRQPVLLLNSRGDRLVAPICSEAIHRQWRIELNTHPWAGHDLSLDDGAWLAQQLKNWVATQSVSTI
jgi:pimeloyl-[acyl-carrier protein] methyl ester esterase